VKEQRYLRQSIRRLRLQPGDAVLCTDGEVIKALAETRIPNCPPCPIFYVPKEAELRVMPKDLLKGIIAEMQKFVDAP
jgi:hypothetical protein